MRFTLYLFLLLFYLSLPNEIFAQQKISLAGEWNFSLDHSDVGVKEQWFNQSLKDKIRLPGSLAEQGKGDEITLNTKWTGSIYDSSFYFNPALEKFRQPGNIHIPFWLTPVKHYVGASWFQKNIVISSKWKNNHITLYLERTHIETRVWINEKEVGLQNSLVAPHIYDITAYLKSGNNRITIRVDNQIKEINVGPDSHSISDHTQGNWNGIIGKIALQSEPLVHIDAVEIYPDLANKKAKVKVNISNNLKQSITGKIKLSAKSFNSSVSHQTKEVSATYSSNTNGQLELDLPMGEGMLTWDEFSPALYKLNISLITAKGESSKEIQFGMRDFKINGKQFLINGRPVFLRGTLHNCEFPLTGYPSTKTDDWLKIFRKIKDYGLNHVRFHSWCPPEAAFIAADIVGLYLLPEAPSWPNHGPKIGLGQPVDQYLYDESIRMVDHYGNYASFVMLSAGNEPAGNQVAYLNKFVDFWKKRDSRRVYTGMSVGGSWPVVPNAEFQVRGGVRGLQWNRMPETYSDFSEQLSKFDVPFVAHENGQYCVFPNFDEIQNYTGAYRAKNMEMFRQILADNHMLDQAKDFLMASGKLQTLAYKHDIERILRTPNYNGFQLLGLQDFPGQGTALVGVLNAFWEEKGYVTADEYRRFSNETVPLAQFPKFVFSNTENFSVDVVLFHSGRSPLENAIIDWVIRDEKGEIFHKGSFDSKSYPIANGIPVGKINQSLQSIGNAKALKLEVSVRGTSFINGWDFWVYPSVQKDRGTSVYYTTELDDAANKVLENGGKVFLNAAGKVVKGKEVEMHFLPVFWNTSWFKMRPPHVTGMLIQKDHKAFSDFPTSYHSQLQWWDIQHKSQVMNLEDFPSSFRPIVQPIDTWFVSRRLGLIFEAKVGEGKIVVSSADLQENLQGKPASSQLFYSILNYMESDNFNPKDKLSLEVIKDIFTTESRTKVSNYTKDSPDELKPNSNQNKIN
jgi:hypothetical protein